MANNDNQRPAAPSNPSSDGLAIAGFALSVIGLFVSMIPVCGSAYALVSLALSLIGRSSVRYRQLALWGVGLSAVALIISVAALLEYDPWRFVAPYQPIYFDF